MTMYYHGKSMGFFNSENPGNVEANQLTFEELTVISEEDYNDWFNPPEGKMGVWVDGRPVLADVPPPDYPSINSVKAESLKNTAMSTVAVITAKMGMNRKLTQAETDKMNAVLDYCDAVDTIDLSLANPEWPVLPS